MEIFLLVTYSEHLNSTRIQAWATSLSYHGITEQVSKCQSVIRVHQGHFDQIRRTLDNFNSLGHLTWSEISGTEAEKLIREALPVVPVKSAPTLLTKRIPSEDKPQKKKKLNSSQKKALKAADLQLFAKEYGRKAQRGKEPNDRVYSRDLQKKVRKIKPEELDKLLNEGEPE